MRVEDYVCHSPSWRRRRKENGAVLDMRIKEGNMIPEKKKERSRTHEKQRPISA